MTDTTTETATRVQRQQAYYFLGTFAEQLAKVAYSTTVHGTAAFDTVHVTILIHAQDEVSAADLLPDLRRAASDRELSDGTFRCYVTKSVRTRIFDIRFYIEREQ